MDDDDDDDDDDDPRTGVSGPETRTTGAGTNTNDMTGSRVTGGVVV
jgi:hypothetical protein